MHGDDLGCDGVEVLRAVARQLGEEGVGRRAGVGGVALGLHRPRQRRRRPPAPRRRRRRHDLQTEGAFIYDTHRNKGYSHMISIARYRVTLVVQDLGLVDLCVGTLVLQPTA